VRISKLFDLNCVWTVCKTVYSINISELSDSNSELLTVCWTVVWRRFLHCWTVIDTYCDSWTVNNLYCVAHCHCAAVITAFDQRCCGAPSICPLESPEGTYWVNSTKPATKSHLLRFEIRPIILDTLITATICSVSTALCHGVIAVQQQKNRHWKPCYCWLRRWQVSGYCGCVEEIWCQSCHYGKKWY